MSAVDSDFTPPAIIAGSTFSCQQFPFHPSKNWKKSGADISLGVSCLFIGESHLNQGRQRKQDSYAGKLNQTEMQVTIIQYLHWQCQVLICVDQGPRAEWDTEHHLEISDISAHKHIIYLACKYCSGTGINRWGGAAIISNNFRGQTSRGGCLSDKYPEGHLFRYGCICHICPLGAIKC